MHHFSSGVPLSKNTALPVIVVDILLNALVFRFSRRLANELLAAAAGGDPLLPPPGPPVVGGRCDTQSWTRRLT